MELNCLIVSGNNYWIQLVVQALEIRITQIRGILQQGQRLVLQGILRTATVRSRDDWPLNSILSFNRICQQILSTFLS